MTIATVSKTRSTFAINRHVMHVSRNVGPRTPVCRNRRALYCTRADAFRDDPATKCAKCAAIFARWETKKAPAALPGFEVNTYDRDGKPMVLVGRFDSIADARDCIAEHACVDLEELGDNNYAGSVLPSIVESWFIGPVEYIIHCNG